MPLDMFVVQNSPDQAPVCDTTAHKDQPKREGMRDRGDVTVWARGASGTSLRGILKEKIHRVGDRLGLGVLRILLWKGKLKLGTRENWGVWVRDAKEVKSSLSVRQT